MDEFENWLTTTYEEPGQEAIEKLLRTARMQPTDWDGISMFVAVQQRRTPLAFLEFAERWPALANESLELGVRQLERRLASRGAPAFPSSTSPRTITWPVLSAF